MARTRRQPQPDLFAAAAIQEARLQAEAAEFARGEALRRAKYAPIGEVIVRRQRAREATLAALQAEILLDKVKGSA